MKGHPGGREMTQALMSLAALEPPGRILDIGAGAGDSLDLMKSWGFEAWGIDSMPRSEMVISATMVDIPFANEFFDAVVAECSFYSSGVLESALAEAYRVVKPEGYLLVSDVFSGSMHSWEEAVIDAGFSIITTQNKNEEWSRYLSRCIWDGTLEACSPKGVFKEKIDGYFLMVCRKE